MRKPPVDMDQQIEAILGEKLPEHLVAARGFSTWYSPHKARVEIAAQQVLDETLEALEDERKRIAAKEGCNRPVWERFLGGGALTKSGASIRSKIGRELVDLQRAGKGGPAGRLSEDQVQRLILGFPDLGRFRIIADYTMDVETALCLLLGPRRTKLLEKYGVRGRFKDYVHDLSCRHPRSGHRARQFAVRVEQSGWLYNIEFQIMTRLQHVWDQRNHPVYEWSREGLEFKDELVIGDVAVAEALYVLDEQATRNWKAFLAAKKKASHAAARKTRES